VNFCDRYGVGRGEEGGRGGGGNLHAHTRHLPNYKISEDAVAAPFRIPPAPIGSSGYLPAKRTDHRRRREKGSDDGS